MNAQTQLDERLPDEAAWSEGNLVRPLVHEATYFRALYDALEATCAGDWVLFTDWQGDADQRLTPDEESEVVEVLPAPTGAGSRSMGWCGARTWIRPTSSSPRTATAAGS